MASNLDELIRLVPPPPSPSGPRGRPLAESLAPFADIPADWRAFIETYGTGAFCDKPDEWPCAEGMWVHNPYRSGYYETICAIFANHWADAGTWDATGDIRRRIYPTPPHPILPGLLPLGGDTQGLNFYYLTDPDPAKWSIVALPPPGGECVPLGPSLIDFLVRAFSGPLCLADWYILTVSEMPAVRFHPYPDGPNAMPLVMTLYVPVAELYEPGIITPPPNTRCPPTTPEVSRCDCSPAPSSLPVPPP